MRSIDLTLSVILAALSFAAAGYSTPSGATLWGMGRSYSGALGQAGAAFAGNPVTIATDVRSAAGGADVTVFLAEDGSLWGLGDNSIGQLGLGAGVPAAETPAVIATDVIAVAAGTHHTLYITRSRALFGMGLNAVGQLGDGTVVPRYKPVHIAADVVAAAGGYLHTLFVTIDGTLWATGFNDSGQLGNGTTQDSHVPVEVATGVKAVSAGAHFSLFLKSDGSLWAMGDNVAGQLGDGTTMMRLSPVHVADDVSSMSAGLFFTAFIKTDGTLWVCGDNPNGQLGTGDTMEVHAPVQVATDVTAVATGAYHMLFRKSDGTVWATGSNYSHQQGDNAPIDQRVTPALVASDMSAVFAGFVHTLFRKPDGTLLGAGSNQGGQLTGAGGLRKSPVHIADEVVGVSSGTHHTAFLKADGTLWTTGYNDEGQLGDGTTRDRPVPAQVAEDVVGFETGTYTTFFIKSDGALWAAGENLRGQLGDGTQTARSTPVQVASDVVDVRASSAHTLFLKSDRTLWGMGWNQFGAITTDLIENISSPVQIADNVVTMDAGLNVTVYVTSDGVLHARGDLIGAFRYENPSVTRTPVEIMAGVADVKLGGGHALVLKTDGSLWGMGNNARGQLGLVIWSMSGVPFYPQLQREPALLTTGITAIAAGGSHSAFLRSDGTLWAMGWNEEGQLGIGSTVEARAPVRVASGVSGIACGTVTTFFLQPTAPTINAHPESGPLGRGATLSVAASGGSSQNFQWFLNGAPLVGANASTLNATAPGTYRVLVGGTTWSDRATLEIPNRLTNFSTLAHVGPGERVLINGFFVRGPPGTEKLVLLRGVGPTLEEFGVSPVLEAPRLTLFQQGGGVRQSAFYRVVHSDWPPYEDYEYYEYPFDVGALASQVGAFPLHANDDASTRPDLLPPGSYSLHISDGAGGDGRALVEFYEVQDDSQPVVNFSSRAWAGRGGDSLIGGFVLTGSEPATLLIRAVGPTLSSYGVTNATSSTTITLFNVHGDPVATNTGWSTSANTSAIATAASQTGAFALSDGSEDSALLMTLEPGTYTVHVAPTAGTDPGIALLEVYIVP